MNSTPKQISISNQEEAVIHFIQTMDIEMIESFLDTKNTYMGFDKKTFISKLEDAFTTMKSSGNTLLLSHRGVCQGCKKGCEGISFVGNHTNDYFDIMIEKEEGKIKDIFECSELKNNDSSTLIKNNRIIIDDEFHGDPF